MNERARTFEGELAAHGLRFGIVAARFNDFVVDRLVKAAVETLTEHGADAHDVEIVRVPGALELPLAAKRMIASGRYDALVALGCVIRGETSHYELVCREASSGLADLGLELDVPIGLGLLTCENVEQALERAGGRAGNKGADAAATAVQMASVLRQLEG